ncbi:TPA: hypothetical protein ACGO7S_000283 [Streptococcus suis]
MRLSIVADTTDNQLISTYAPVWGATDIGEYISGANEISIHAPVWGATRWSVNLVNVPYDFNPRTRVGCDEFCEIELYDVYDFNPRTRVGCDSNLLYDCLDYSNFNPRTRVGCDRTPETLAHF